MTPKYFECHITVEPVFGERLDVFARLCTPHKFKAAKLLMQKRQEDTPQRSAKDTFCTGHSQSFEDMAERMRALVADLRNAGFSVWRYKIEAVVLDERVKPEAAE